MTVAALGLGLAACSVAPEAVTVRPPLQGYGACMSTLTAERVSFRPVAAFRTREGCGVAHGVEVSALPLPLSRPTLLSCSMAQRLVVFDQRILQPAARRYFGLSVARIDHVGSYACRRMTENRRRLSEHAYARAIDIIGFELSDGTRISVGRDWRGHGAKSAFLHALARQACSVFSEVLTPAADPDHRDHIHLDIGPFRVCET